MGRMKDIFIAQQDSQELSGKELLVRQQFDEWLAESEPKPIKTVDVTYDECVVMSNILYGPNCYTLDGSIQMLKDTFSATNPGCRVVVLDDEPFVLTVELYLEEERG